MSEQVSDGPHAPLAADDEIVRVIEAALAALHPPNWRTGASSAWRFSGRWWAQPPPLRRDRPRR